MEFAISESLFGKCPLMSLQVQGKADVWSGYASRADHPGKKMDKTSNRFFFMSLKLVWFTQNYDLNSCLQNIKLSLLMLPTPVPSYLKSYSTTNASVILIITKSSDHKARPRHVDNLATNICHSFKPVIGQCLFKRLNATWGNGAELLRERLNLSFTILNRNSALA